MAIQLSDALKDNVYNYKRNIEKLVEEGNIDTVTAGVEVGFPCDGITETYQTNGALYDESTGEIDCSGFAVGTDMLIRWDASVNSTAEVTDPFTLKIVVPDGVSAGVDKVEFTRDYELSGSTPIPVSEMTIIPITPLIMTNNLRVLVVFSGASNGEINDRDITISQ